MREDSLYLPAEELLKLIRGQKAIAYSKEYGTFSYEIEVKG
jgi:hypothetical protein